MIFLAGYLTYQAAPALLDIGRMSRLYLGRLSYQAGEVNLAGPDCSDPKYADTESCTLEDSEVLKTFGKAVAIVVNYFSGPMLNFGDFSRYAATPGAVLWGNFWGLPVNFLGFSIITVVTISATDKVFGERIDDPVAVVAKIDSDAAAIIGALTFAIATVGITTCGVAMGRPCE